MKPRIALLVDADQVGPEGIPALVDRLSKKWSVDERICVRNWRSTRDQQLWRKAADELGLRLIQRDPVATGKNAADIELAIITMDLYHEGRRAFCLVTGDMDFRPLIERLRRGDATVIWEGPDALTLGKADPRAKGGTKKATRKSTKKATKKATPETKKPRKAARRPSTKASPGSTPSRQTPGEADLKSFAKAVRRVVGELQKEGLHERGWVSVNRVGNRLNVRGPWKDDFGFPKRRTLHEALGEAKFKVEQIETGAYRVKLR